MNAISNKMTTDTPNYIMHIAILISKMCSLTFRVKKLQTTNQPTNDK